jgi:D-3-phosphoglycerate dehydrogenase / 2-oxoglutarate reductase
MILIADEIHSSLLEDFSSEKWLYAYEPHISKEELLAKEHPYTGLVIRSKCKIDEVFLTKFPNLQWIARAGAGLDLFDLEAINQKNIAVFTANEGNKDAVAEHCLAMILALFNNINQAHSQVLDNVWLREENRGEELMGKTVGIIGFGHNGQATALRFLAMGCQVLAYDPTHTQAMPEGISLVSLPELQAKADIISLHTPLTPTTKHLVNNEFFEQCKQNIYIINIARGEIVVLEDLLNNLRSGKVRGACLDVLENEKLQQLSPQQKEVFEGLKKEKSVLFSPHIAGWTHQSYLKINQVLFQKISQWHKQHNNTI